MQIQNLSVPVTEGSDETLKQRPSLITINNAFEQETNFKWLVMNSYF